MTDINTAYQQYVLTKDGETLQRLAQDGEGLVRHFANLYGEGLDRDDLYQTGMIGLLRAAKTYDPQSGAAFSTWVSTCVISEIRHYVRRERAAALLCADYSERAGENDDEPERATHIADACSGAAELDGRERMRSFHLALEDKVALEQAAAKLGELQRKVINALFYRGLTQQQTAEELGLTQRSVSRIKVASLKLLGEVLNSASFRLLDADYTFKPVAVRKKI